MRRLVSLGVATVVVAGMAAVSKSGAPSADASTPSRSATTCAKTVAPRSWGSVPLAFEANRGQTDARVRFLARCPGMTAFFTPSETVLAAGSSDVVRLRFVGADAESAIEADGPLPGKSNYFIGSDASKWITAVPHFRGVSMRGLYAGIDVRWRGDADGRLAYEIDVAPGADLSHIEFVLDGARDVRIAGDGVLLAGTASGELRQSKPVAWQVVDGERRPVDVAFALTDDRVRFEVGGYDAARVLVVDPSLTWSTFHGGSAADQPAFSSGIAVDGSGAAYVAGTTVSTDFPVQGPFQGTLAVSAGNNDAFVSKFDPTGTSLVYSTYLGGVGQELTYAIAVDGAGAAYVAGRTDSTNFPTQSPVQSANGGGGDGFISKIAPSGAALAWSTFLGGSGFDQIFSVAVDAGGVAFVAGQTQSGNFPTVSPIQSAPGAATSVFAAKFNASGTGLAWSTYLGGAGVTDGGAIAVDAAGAVYVGGSAAPSGLPVASSVQSAYGGGGNDVFVLKINPAGTTVLWGTYLGGSGTEYLFGIAVDSAGAVHLSGKTSSTDFPTVSPFQSAYGGGQYDEYVAKINASGTAVVWSTYLGGSGIDGLFSNPIAVNSAGAVTVVSCTSSSDFPVTTSATQASYGGGPYDAFVTQFNASGSALVFSTFLGGSGTEYARGVALDATGAVYVTGSTDSANFPVQSPRQTAFGGGGDAFVAKYALGSGPGGPGPTPAAPTNLVANYAALSGVTLSWIDGATNETDFLVERKPGTLSFSLFATPPANTTTLVDTLLYPNTTYTYRVLARNANGSSAWSNEASATTGPEPPVPAPPKVPGGLTASATANGLIALAWTDESPDEVSFEVARASGGGASKTLVDLRPNAVAYVDADVHPGWPYAYRVRALSLQGASGWSNIASATTPSTIDLSLLSGALFDSPKPKHDSVKFVANYALGASAYSSSLDPVADGLSMQMGPASAPVALSIAPNDPAWKVKRTKATKKKPSVATSATWKSAKGASPSTAITVDFVHRKITTSLSAFDFAGATTAPIRLLVACGPDGGAHDVGWTERRPGMFKFAAK